MDREESFKIYYESFKKTFGKLYSDDEIINKVNWLLDKHETLPKSSESITVRYYDFLIDVEEIERFREKLNQKNIELGHYNKKGDIHNAFELPDISVIVNNPIVLGVAANLVTELVKSVYRKIKGKKLTSIRGQKETGKAVVFEVEIRETKNKKSQFRIKGEFTDNQINKLFDKIPEVSKQNDNREPEGMHDLTKRYKPNSEKTKWEELDLLEQMRIARELQEKNSKE